ATMVDLARGAQDAGVDAVQVLGPKPGPLPMRPDELDAYFSAVIGAVTCPVHLANNPVLLGTELPAHHIAEWLATVPPVRVLNVSDPRPDALLAFVARFADEIDVRVGITTQLAAATGARGLLSFEANVAPALVASACASGGLEPLLGLNTALARGGNPRS